MAGQTIQISVLADTKQFSRAMRGLGDATGLNRLAAGARTAAVGLAKLSAAGAVAAGAGLAKAVGAASSLQQAVGGVDAVFKENADTIHKWAQGAATSAGLSQRAYSELATVLGSQLKNGGTAVDELAGKTDGLIKTGADLAAQFGGTTEQAVAALSSALKGERDPIEAYGVSLNQAAIDAKAAELGFTKVGGALSAEANQAATLALIMQQTTDAHGAFSRESNTLAGQWERLKATGENLAARIGTYLLPVLTTLVAWVGERGGPAFERLAAWIKSNALPALQQLGAFLQSNVLPALQRVGQFITGTVVPALVQLATWVQANSSWLAPLAVALGSAAVAFVAVQRAMMLYQAVVTTVKAAQIALNLAMAANPLGLIIAAVAALVGALIYLWNTNEGFRNAVLTVWEAIKTGIGVAVQWVKDRIEELGQVPGKIGEWFSRAGALARAAFDKMVADAKALPGKVVAGLAALGSMLLQRATSAFQQFLGGVTQGAERAYAFVRSIPQRIQATLGNLGSLLLSAGRKVIDGFLSGITGGFNKVKDKLTSLTDMLPDWKGPAKRDATLLRDNGRLVIDGFTRGLQSRFGSVRRTLGRFTRSLADTPMPELRPLVAAPELEPLPGGLGAARLRGGNTYVVHVSALTPTPEVGRVVKEALADYDRLNGGR